MGGRGPPSRATRSGPWRAPGYVRAPGGTTPGAFAPEKSYDGPVRRTAAYLRVSTRGQSEALQREAIVRAAAARGEPQPDLWFSEVRGGSAKLRPELDAARALARRGELSRLWIFKVDRVTRRGASDLLALVHELRRHGCTLTAVSDPLDFEGPIGDIVLAVLGAVAEIELNLQRERREAARALAESKGVKWGRPRLGTDILEEIDAFRLLLERGLTIRAAAKEAGLSYGTARRLITGERQLQSSAQPANEGAK